ncbi:hypothetical protein ACCO45_003438 [Purpureocillium lilacinum]|uniref:Uncharacterized protein n=1 Tax=Purpureocillium lilacinum TaxID=33203 RepID=A0ACC4DZW0_PURLI
MVSRWRLPRRHRPVLKPATALTLVASSAVGRVASGATPAEHQWKPTRTAKRGWSRAAIGSISAIGTHAVKGLEGVVFGLTDPDAACPTVCQSTCRSDLIVAAFLDARGSVSHPWGSDQAIKPTPGQPEIPKDACALARALMAKESRPGECSIRGLWAKITMTRPDDATSGQEPKKNLDKSEGNGAARNAAG